MNIHISWKILLGALTSLLVLGAFSFLGYVTYKSVTQPVQIVIWESKEQPDYVCFVALQGTNRLRAMECLQKVEEK